MDLVLDRVRAEPAVQLALEEALVRCAPAAPTLRVWSMQPAVVVGRFQDVGREVAVAACVEDGVAVVRRASGGGTVVHDFGTLNASLILPGRALDAEGRLADLLLRALARLGVHAERRERGLFIDGRKVSGSACLNTGAATLAHASLLVTTSAATVGRYLTPAPDVPGRRDSHRTVVASLREHGVDIDVARAAAAVRDAVGEHLHPRALNAREETEHERLMEVRYRDPLWHLTGRRKEGAWTTPHVSRCIA